MPITLPAENKISLNNLIWAFSHRQDQNMSLVYGDTANSLKARENFLSGLGINYADLVCAKQVHASKVRYVREEDRGRGALFYDTAFSDTDAFVTDKMNLPLAVFTADCLSVFLYAQEIPAIGLAHAGWRSSRENIVMKTVKLMQDKFKVKPRKLFARFGPGIRDCCYEVGEDFRQFFSRGLKNRGQRYYLDLASINQQQLLDCGIPKDNIFDGKICTSCQNHEFFSYRREGKSCGRMMSVIMLK